MNKTRGKWQDVVRSRFGERQDISKSELYSRYWASDGLAEASVLECLDLIEVEYQLPAGILRPQDKLEDLFDPVATKNPLRWLEYQTGADDRKSEVNYQLAKRMKQHETLGAWTHIETVDDLVHAWCGRTPLDNRNRR
ncbi:MAG: hypothetical protein ACRD9S_11350 [Pyrinomonadaceae bacterium]